MFDTLTAGEQRTFWTQMMIWKKSGDLPITPDFDLLVDRQLKALDAQPAKPERAEAGAWTAKYRVGMEVKCRASAMHDWEAGQKITHITGDKIWTHGDNTGYIIVSDNDIRPIAPAVAEKSKRVFDSDREKEATGTDPQEQIDREAFLSHLEYCKKLVATWPQWKQEILGAFPPEQPKERAGEGDGVRELFEWYEDRNKVWTDGMIASKLDAALAAWQIGNYKPQEEWGQSNVRINNLITTAESLRQEKDLKDATIASLRQQLESSRAEWEKEHGRTPDGIWAGRCNSKDENISSLETTIAALRAELARVTGLEVEARSELAAVKGKLGEAEKWKQSYEELSRHSQYWFDKHHACWKELQAANQHVKIVTEARQALPREPALGKTLMDAAVKWREWEGANFSELDRRAKSLMEAIDAAKGPPTLPYEETLKLVSELRRYLGTNSRGYLVDALAAFERAGGQEKQQ